jgi:hypothetical protein
MAAPDRTACPICFMAYRGRLPGVKCGDTSQGQQRACVGRLMPWRAFSVAEWRFPSALVDLMDHGVAPAPRETHLERAKRAQLERMWRQS